MDITRRDIIKVLSGGVFAKKEGEKLFILDPSAVGNADQMQVLAAGTTHARDLKDRFADVINVKDFGAKGDGITDDTGAIQAALDAVSNGYDKKNIVGYGNFLISKTLKVSSGYKLSVYFERLSVSDNWEEAENDPAISITARGCTFAVSILDCNHKSAGVYIGTSGVLFGPNCSVNRFRTYGITWGTGAGGSLILNPTIVQASGSLGDDINNLALRDGVGVLVNNSFDMKIVGGHIGRCGLAVKLMSGRHNYFQDVHMWTGRDDGTPWMDPVLIENYAEQNFMYNCYFDSGHIDLYNSSLIVNGGEFVENSAISTITEQPFRMYRSPFGNSTFPQSINITNVLNGRVGFYNTNDAEQFSGDYSVINALPQVSGSSWSINRTKKHISPKASETNEVFYTPDTSWRREYRCANSPSFQEVISGASIRYRNADGTAGSTIYFGGGNTGIGEYLSGGNNRMFVGSAGVILNSQKKFYPETDADLQLGQPSYRWKDIYASSSTINTSDSRDKQSIQSLSDIILDAWGDVEFRSFLFNEAVNKKGNSARIHSGVIAQQVIDAFSKHKLDATNYALLCYDEWKEETFIKKVVDKAEELDENGELVSAEESHTETVHITAGNRYGIRYSEALCIEAAYQRRRADRMEERLAKLEAALGIPEV